MTVLELRDLCVVGFPLSTTRAAIMDGLEEVITRLEADGIEGDLWIDGSFVTEKIHADDADVALRSDGIFLDGLGLAQRATLDWFQDVDLKRTHHVDSYLFPYYPETDSRYWYGEYKYAYWLKWYGFNRPSTEMKGIPLIQNRRWLMTSMQDLAAQLQDINVALANSDRVIGEAGMSPSLEMSRQSLEKRQRTLEQAFLEETEQSGIDVCSYRLFSDSGQPKVLAVGKAMVSFQNLVSSVYGAIRGGKPRRSNRISAEAAALSSFDFGYAFPGSVGFVLTIPNERLLVGGSHLDESIERVFELSRAETPAQFASHAETLGPAPIRAMHRWTEVHVESELGADIEWRRALDVRAEIRLQLPEIDQLRMTIEATSTEENESITISAMLRMFHADRRSFIFAFEGGDTVHGVLAEGFPMDEPLRVPLRYTASLTKTTVRHIATDEVDEKWTLDKLEPV